MERKPVVLSEGRWTTQRPDETPTEAMNRLTAGDGKPMSEHPLSRFLRREKRPHFR